jgi:hypothetical protein
MARNRTTEQLTAQASLIDGIDGVAKPHDERAYRPRGLQGADPKRPLRVRQTNFDKVPTVSTKRVAR